MNINKIIKEEIDRMLNERFPTPELKLDSTLVNRHFITRLTDEQLKDIITDLDQYMDKRQLENMSRNDMISLIFSYMD